ncbi:HD domain-containing protein [Desulfonatronum sp. SC1]|uniref:HD domain-containing protein n=1 Tax=Desulfonatronum sp. SC1 TaxID=2109626 RepID=UPI000D2FE5B1|nr:HD domain-containing protein [Desulfonatronum sp. SC1]PTN32182.1 phosphohydrolase [Desulfonatronum sp. SC1]
MTRITSDFDNLSAQDTASSDASLPDGARNQRLTHFFFEIGMLRKTPRTGYQFLGSGRENVAEHSFRTTVIAYVLASLTGASMGRTMGMALFHDLHETRIGDFNYVNRIYNSRNALLALEHALEGTGLNEVLQWWHELEEEQTLEARLVHDADQLDLILNLKQEQDLGNPYAAKWIDCAVPRLRTDVAKALAEVILHTDHADWWFSGPDPSWWRK